jgi:hypothetical protein
MSAGAIVDGYDFVYKILADAPPEPLPHALPLSALDKQDGFIHLSTARQTPVTASLFFGAQAMLWVLKVSVERVRADAEGGEFLWAEVAGCPHLFGRQEGRQARLGEGVVVHVKRFDRKEGQSWEDAMKSQGAFLSDH